VGLLRQMLKPLYKYLREPEYRAYLRVQQHCRHKSGKHVTIWLDGYVVEGNDGPALLHQYEEIVQRRSFDFKTANASPVIFCCGANIGLEVLHLEQLYPGARIKAYEPDPQLFAVLKSNIERNESRAEAFNVALSTSNGKIFFQPDGKLGGKVGAGPLEVEAKRLRDILAGEQHIDLLIMDIEGAENNVLPDCADQLAKVDALFVEWHSPENSPQDLSAILDLLKAAGFRYRLNNNLGNEPFVNAVSENGFDAMVEIYATRTIS
jgi:FkbM family methyltransferase